MFPYRTHSEVLTALGLHSLPAVLAFLAFSAASGQPTSPREQIKHIIDEAGGHIGVAVFGIENADTIRGTGISP